MDTEISYKQLQQDLHFYLPLLGKAADTILDQDVSKYPILIIHKFESLELGIPLLQREEPTTLWSVQASTLEELVAKQLIEVGKVDHFRAIYKDPQEYLCLFVLMDVGANFIFLPRAG